MLKSLVGSLEELFGRTFLLTGLLPAAVVLIGNALAQRRDITDWFGSEGEQALMGGVLLFGLALIFYAVHRPLFNLLQDLPGPLLGWLRLYLYRHQEWKFENLNREYQRHFGELAATNWFEEDKFEPREESARNWERHPRVAKVLKNSVIARTIAKAAAKGSDDQKPRREKSDLSLLTLKDIRRIVIGLYHLDLSIRTVKKKEKLIEELENWKTDVEANPQMAKVLERISGYVIRSINEKYRILNNRYPPHGSLLRPTAIGNKIAALDTYAEDRYGIESGLLWTRLWGVLDDEQRKPVAAAQLSVFMLVNLSMACLVLVLLVLFGEVEDFFRFLWGADLKTDWNVVFVVAGGVFALMLFYAMAVASMDTVIEQYIRLIDLHRGKLIKQLGFAPPVSPTRERALFSELSKFYKNGTSMKHHWTRIDEEGAELDRGAEPLWRDLTAEKFMVPIDAIPEELLNCEAKDYSLKEAMKWMDVKKHDCILVLNPVSRSPRAVMPIELLQKYFIRRFEEGVTPEELSAIMLNDFENDDLDWEAHPGSTVVVVDPEADLEAVEQALNEAPDSRIAVVTEDGSAESRTLGWIPKPLVHRIWEVWREFGSESTPSDPECPD